MARRFGYSRVSTSDQDWSLQLEAVLTKGADLGRPIFPHSPGASWRLRVRQMPRVYDPIGSGHLPDAGCGALLRATPPSCALPELF
jgi:hypothetical protein